MEHPLEAIFRRTAAMLFAGHLGDPSDEAQKHAEACLSTVPPERYQHHLQLIYHRLGDGTDTSWLDAELRAYVRAMIAAEVPPD